MYTLVHQIKLLNYDTDQKNIVNSVSLSFLETFLTIATLPPPPQTCTAQLLPTT